MDQTLLDGITVRHGQDLLLTARIGGKPIPRVTWSHGNNDIKESDFVKVTNTHTQSALLIKDSKLKHSGEYTCSVSNHYGNKQVSCKVNVLDKPGPVPLLKSGVTERVRLQWQPPKEPVVPKFNDTC